MNIPIWVFVMLLITIVFLLFVNLHEYFFKVLARILWLLDIPINAIPRIFFWIWNFVLEAISTSPEAISLILIVPLGYYLGCAFQAIALAYLFNILKLDFPIELKIIFFFLPLFLKPLSKFTRVIFHLPSRFYNKDYEELLSING
ncbi:MAG: hypothetical protein ACP5OG_02170 [Candidatus Nanoarchaeia archaeon]